MSSCCEDKSCEISAMRQSHGKVLWIVLAINAAMFFIEGIGGILAESTSLLADALDMLGDALVYGFSLLVLTRPPLWQARAALAKGLFMLIFGIGVLAEAIYKFWHPPTLELTTMGSIGFLALIANLTCFALLYRHRSDNLNMSSTWLCSRNDLIANVGVLVAAAGSYLLSSYWPDIAVGAIIAVLFVTSAFSVLRQAATEMKPKQPASPAVKINIVTISRPGKIGGDR